MLRDTVGSAEHTAVVHTNCIHILGVSSQLLLQEAGCYRAGDYHWSTGGRVHNKTPQVTGNNLW